MWYFIFVFRPKGCCRYSSLTICNSMLDKIKLNIFVRMNMITILIYYMHIRAQSWHRCGWFGNYLDGIVSFFSRLLSSRLFLFSTILHFCLFVLTNSKVFNFISLFHISIKTGYHLKFHCSRQNSKNIIVIMK